MRLLSEIRNYMTNYHVRSGIYHYYRNEFSQAVSYLRKALADASSLAEGDRKNARSYLTLSLKGLGEKLAAKGEVEAGVEELRRAAGVDPTYPDIHYRIAELLERIEHRDEAIEAYRRAITCKPDYLEAQVALGNCLLGAGRVEEAADVLRRAMELKLERVRRPFERGVEALERGGLDAAREWFHETFAAAPQLANEYMNKAVEWLRGEEYERAVEWLDRAISIHPKYPDLHNYRGIALCELERYEEALAAFRRSSELRPAHVVPRLNLAFTFLRAGRPDEGEAELRAVLEQDPDEPVALAKLEELRSARHLDRRGSGVRS